MICRIPKLIYPGREGILLLFLHPVPFKVKTPPTPAFRADCTMPEIACSDPAASQRFVFRRKIDPTGPPIFHVGRSFLYRLVYPSVRTKGATCTGISFDRDFFCPGLHRWARKSSSNVSMDRTSSHSVKFQFLFKFALKSIILT